MKSTENVWSAKLKINHIYIANVKFEDGYDKKIGTNKKIRPVLIIDKFFNKSTMQAEYIIAPIYSVKNNELDKSYFKSKYKYHCYIKDWKNSFHNNKEYYQAKFKISQIQIITKKSFIKNIKNGIFLYKKIDCNSPIQENNLEKLNSKIHQYYLDNEINKNEKLKKILNFYLKHSKKIKTKELEKNNDTILYDY